MADKQAKIMLAVRVSPELHALLDDVVERTGVSRTDVVERCLWVGLKDEQGFVKALESPVYGAFARFATHPTLLKVVAALTGGEVDEVGQQVRKNVGKGRRKGRVANG